MKTLYQIRHPWSDGTLFYWADSEEQALEMAYQQGMSRDIEDIHADRVWANNANSEYRGYVVEGE